MVLQQGFFSTPATCFDGTQNGGEAGVDCGDPCALICESSALAPTVLWARALPSGGRNYTAVAYIQNKNFGASAENVHYTFKLYDPEGLLVIQKDGLTSLPPTNDGKVPIIENNLNVGNRTVSRTIFEFTAPVSWYKVKAGSVPLLQSTPGILEEDNMRLTTTVSNNSLFDADDVTVVALLVDASGEVKAASESVITTIPRRSSQQVIFTWPIPHPEVVRAQITILPSL